ncbi:MAG: c-type cytochrome, partial [Hyphomicrobiaceae bacterium]
MRWENRPLAKRIVSAAAIAAAIVGGGVAWIAVPPRIEPDKAGAAVAIDPALIERGRYLAQVGDCVACHTGKGGPPMAGGLALETPFGTVWSTNITPDPKTGIGGWSFGAFDRAMRKGVSRDGHRLYPAMPYPSFAKVHEEDMRALWAYLSKGLAPVEKANRAAEMRFPFGFRLGLAYWNAVFLDTTPFEPNAQKDALWNRGAYLVQGLGHCGACHTPRGLGFQEKAMSDAGREGRLYVSGAQVEDWNAVDLRDVWAVEDMVRLLKTGQNRFATVSGSMTEVIHFSTQHISNDDLVAIATYLKALPSDRPKATPRPVSPQTPSTTYITRGGLGYTQFCSDCHRPDGAGVPGVFPPLAGNPTVAAKDASTLVHIALTGWKTASTAAHRRVFTMPAFARLHDREIADILSFVRASWGENAGPVAETDVAAVRATLDPKFAASSFETPRLANLLSAPNADQLVRGMRLNAETKALLPDHVGADLNCASCHLNAGTVADATPYVGVSVLFPSYSARSGSVITLAQRINGCFQRSMNGKPLATDSPEMQAMIAYFEWMKGEAKPQAHAPGSGMGGIDTSLKPDRANGRKVYAAQCAVCHGADGEGSKDAAGRTVFPPLWGDRSFNVGAGM